VAQHAHNAVVEEFGDLNFNESFGEESSQKDMEFQEVYTKYTEHAIDIADFPWATGENKDLEATGAQDCGIYVLKTSFTQNTHLYSKQGHEASS
jgi:hypothetical protein